MKHAFEAAALREQTGRLGASLEDDQLQKLLRYERMLVERAVPMGLIAESDIRKIRSRHVLDSLRAAPLLAGAGDAYDLGAGAGLPGLVIAIARPEVHVGLVDSRRGRVAFLELAIEELSVSNATAFGARVEALSEPVDVCLARAFAPAARAWELAEPLLRPGGRLVYFAGVGEETKSLRDRPSSSAGARGAGIPSNARVLEVLSTPVLESAGPLVIMARQ
ncbi:MAG TPA: 16S rRNA (guanine(527)-N(7))-methyltransferase RsmG [Actinomycetota bacterium]|nr:16S rRNA (guanine(527)-N(7))-methyltransferase RsmG [Actinomycetota bacterium]